MEPICRGASLVLAAAMLQAQAEPAIEPLPTADDAIYVTGTRIQAPNRTSVSPVESVRREEFTLTGVANVEETLNQLPQIKPSFSNTSNNPGSGAATLDLRGLGTVRTLILVNGRRWIANDAAAVPEIDVNTIPAALIDRVDIVTGGASAVYGSDAVTGVINFILKKTLDGLYFEANNNVSEMGDGRSTNVDVSYGTSFLRGRGNLIASVGWLDQAPIVQGDRDYTRFTLRTACIFRDSRNSLGVGTPSIGTDCNGANEEWGLVPSGSSTVPEGLFRANGRAILLPAGGSALTPIGTAHFRPDGSIERFITQLHSYNFAPDNYLQVPLQRISGHVFGSVEFAPAFEPYVELSFIRTRSPQQLAPVPGAIGSGSDSVAAVTINLDNPFLSPQARQVLETTYGIDAAGRPGFVGNGQIGFSVNPAFTGDADGLITLRSAFSTRLTGLGPRIVENERKAYRGLLGMRGELSRRWSYDLFYSHSYVAHDVDYLNTASARRLQQAMLATVDSAGNIVCIDPSNGCEPINIFGVQDISDAAGEFLRIAPVEKTRVEEQMAEASVRGDMMELPAGPLKAVGGASWRRTKYDFMPDRSFEDGDALGFFTTTAAAGKVSVIELFGEALVPIIERRPFAYELTAELGLRFSDYDSVGGVWTWKAMANWAPIRELRFRAGLQKAVRAPNVRELFEESAANFDFISDPCTLESGFEVTPELIAACARNGAPVLPEEGGETLIHTSGSNGLKAETARTLTIGAVARPIDGADLAIDYFDINIRDVIDVFGGGASFAVAGCIFGGGDPADPLCQAFVRDEAGLVTDIFTPTANLARLRARGVDWQFSYRFPLAGGRATLGLSGSRLLAFDNQVNSNIAPIHLAGTYSYPKWKVFNQFSWSLAPATLSLRHRYFSPTKDTQFAYREALGQPPPENLAVHAHKLQARHYFDAAASFDLNRTFRLTLGVNNLTNAKPSLIGEAPQSNTDPSLYDVIGRRFFASISAKIL